MNPKLAKQFPQRTATLAIASIAVVVAACSPEVPEPADANAVISEQVDSCDLRPVNGTCLEYTLNELDDWYRGTVERACKNHSRGDIVGKYTEYARCPSGNRVARCNNIIEFDSERYEYDKHYYTGTADGFSWQADNVRATCQALSGDFSAPAAGAVQIAQSRQMVLTIDDLPYQSSGHPDTFDRASEVTTRLLKSLARFQAPANVFVNEANLQIKGDTGSRIGLLEQWAEYGANIGNHTYSHADLNRQTAQEYQEEIRKGEVSTLEVMASRRPYQQFFRHPYTHTGDTEEKKTSVTRFLEDNGYLIAPYTIDSQDSIFNRIYLDALVAEDLELCEQIKNAYVDFVIEATAFAERISVEVFGEEIPQTLILHANRINADTFDTLLEQLVQRRYEFVRLVDVMKHPAYQTEDTLVTSYGPSWLWRWSKSMGQDISFRGDPEPPGWVLNQFRNAQSQATNSD